MSYNKESGFTLAELVVTAGLVGFISLTLMENIKSIANVSKEATQNEIISSTTKSISILLQKSKNPTAPSAKNCSNLITPGGAIATSLNPLDFIPSTKLGNGLSLDSMTIAQNASANNRIPLTVSLSFIKKKENKEVAITRRIEVSVGKSNGIFECLTYDGETIVNDSYSRSCAILDSSNDCSFSGLNTLFATILNKHICNLLSATNSSYTGSTICNSVRVSNRIHGKNISLTGNTVLAEDKVCVGAQCRNRFDNTPCAVTSGRQGFLKTQAIDGKVKICGLPTFNYITP